MGLLVSGAILKGLLCYLPGPQYYFSITFYSKNNTLFLPCPIFLNTYILPIYKPLSFSLHLGKELRNSPKLYDFFIFHNIVTYSLKISYDVSWLFLLISPNSSQILSHLSTYPTNKYSCLSFSVKSLSSPVSVGWLLLGMKSVLECHWSTRCHSIVENWLSFSQEQSNEAALQLGKELHALFSMLGFCLHWACGHLMRMVTVFMSSYGPLPCGV